MAEKLKSLEVGQVIEIAGGVLTIRNLKLQESALRRGDPERWYTRVWYTYRDTVTGKITEESADSKVLLSILNEEGLI